MLTTIQSQLLVEDLVGEIELPTSAYDTAKRRYDDLGDWFERGDSLLETFDPHVFAQGSFRLGTAVKPLSDDAYDVDVACKLRVGVSKATHSQEDLKLLVGRELESYRQARGIQKPKEEKHRCWRLEYLDDLNFHMDIVPCIPGDTFLQERVFASVRTAGIEDVLARRMAETAVCITDNRHPDYAIISDNWNISNPEGYTAWFEQRMHWDQSPVMLKEAQVDRVPIYARKTPLQRAIQLLKRHRDIMFADDADVKPISIILTTLAARAYRGEKNEFSAVANILENMHKYVLPNRPRVPNPVDPNEDFADRWSRPDCVHLNLEQHLWDWLTQAHADFKTINNSADTGFIQEHAATKFGAKLAAVKLADRLGIKASSIQVHTPQSHSIPTRPRPWSAPEE